MGERKVVNVEIKAMREGKLGQEDVERAVGYVESFLAPHHPSIEKHRVRGGQAHLRIQVDGTVPESLEKRMERECTGVVAEVSYHSQGPEPPPAAGSSPAAAASNVRDLRRQVAELDGEVSRLRTALDQAQREAKERGATADRYRHDLAEARPPLGEGLPLAADMPLIAGVRALYLAREGGAARDLLAHADREVSRALQDHGLSWQEAAALLCEDAQEPARPPEYEQAKELVARLSDSQEGWVRDARAFVAQVDGARERYRKARAVQAALAKPRGALSLVAEAADGVLTLLAPAAGGEGAVSQAFSREVEGLVAGMAQAAGTAPEREERDGMVAYRVAGGAAKAREALHRWVDGQERSELFPLGFRFGVMELASGPPPPPPTPATAGPRSPGRASGRCMRPSPALPGTAASGCRTTRGSSWVRAGSAW